MTVEACDFSNAEFPEPLNDELMEVYCIYSENQAGCVLTPYIPQQSHQRLPFSHIQSTQAIDSSCH